MSRRTILVLSAQCVGLLLAAFMHGNPAMTGNVLLLILVTALLLPGSVVAAFFVHQIRWFDRHLDIHASLGVAIIAVVLNFAVWMATRTREHSTL